MAALLIGCFVAMVVLFAIARVLFGSAGAVLLTGAVGFCFGGPPGAGAGIIVGLVLVPIAWLVAAALDRASE